MEKSMSKKVVSFILVICMVISFVPISDDFFDYNKVAAADSSNTFHVSGTKILDANGNEFIMRGINHAHVWYTDQLDTAIPAIANTGSNCVRLVFSDGKHANYESGGWSNPATTASEMENAIKKCIDNKLIPIVEVHDATGVDDVGALRDCANYWTQSDIKNVLKTYEKYVILNIANEWYGEHDQNSVWKNGYKEVIPTIRNAGINNMIMVDSAGWGQASDVLINDCTEVFNSDPNKNVVFSSHMYSCYNSDDKLTSLIDGVLAKNVPLVIGEFGWKHSYVNVSYKKIMSYCKEKGVGYIAWSWKGNGGSDECLDMANSWDGSSLTNWGSEAVEDIKNTSEICSIFGGSVKRISLSPSSASFKTGEASDVTATINNLESNSVTSASCNGKTLSNGSDYSVSGSSITIKKSFLSSLSTGTSKITFNFSNSQSAVFTVTVSDDSVITTKETTLWEGSTDLDNWNGMVSIDGSLNVDWSKANLKVYYDNGSSTQLQLAYNDSNGDWQTIVDYVGASSSPYTFELTADQLSALKSAKGIFVKGTGATVTKVTAVNPDAQDVDADVKFSKTTGTFVTVAPKDIDVTMELNGKTLTSAACSGKTLTAGSDYTVSGESLSIKKSFLSTLSVGSHTIVFNFSDSKTIEFNVTVSDEEMQYDSVVLYEGSFATGNFDDMLEIKRGMGAWDHATLRLEYSITSGAGELQLAYADEKNCSWTYMLGTEKESTVAVTGTEKEFELTDEQIVNLENCQRFYFKGKNLVIKKIEIVGGKLGGDFDKNHTTKTMWSGSKNMTSWDDILQIKGGIGNVPEGSAIRCDFDFLDPTTPGAVLQLACNVGEEFVTVVRNVDARSDSYVFRLTSDMISTLANCDMVNFKGAGYTLKEVKLITPKTGDDDTKYISDCTISLANTSYTYTGSAIEPAVTVKDGSKVLTKGTDYTVTYSNNVNVGTATVTITGKGDYTGSAKKTFTIKEAVSDEKDISKCTVTLSNTSFAYTGKAVKPKVTVKNGSTVLTLNTDYLIRYIDNIDVGTAYVKISGKGNYTGSVTKSFTITDGSTKALSSCSISLNKTMFKSTGKAIKPRVIAKDGTKTLTAGTDYLVRYVDNVEPGTASVIIAGRGKYTGSVTKTFKILDSNAKDINQCTITLNKSSFSYTGKAVKPRVTVKDGSTVLTATVDYNVKYVNNVNKGTATVVISGTGKYQGVVNKTFKIV